MLRPPRNLLSVLNAGCLVGALIVAVSSTPVLADNHGNQSNMERQQSQPLSLKIKQNSNVETPRRGEAMESVLRRFGDPTVIKSPVGEPPITRWQYPRFEVVFEHESVIHTVVEPDSSG